MKSKVKADVVDTSGLKSKTSLDKAILQVIEYFSFFSYAPSCKQIYTYLPIKSTQKDLELAIEKLVHNKQLLKDTWTKAKTDDVTLYAMPGEGILFKRRKRRDIITQEKLKKVERYIRRLSRFEAIKLIGLSGSCTMGNAKPGDDIDLFIISSEKRMWTARIIATVLAEIMGIRRRRGVRQAPDKICLNMYFDHGNLSVPMKKRSLYTAHEVLQMRPFEQHSSIDTYRQFLKANSWIRDYFPNISYARMGIFKARKNSKRDKHIPRDLNILQKVTEDVVKRIQLHIIHKHITNELISDTQLWFFPNDFGKKLSK